MSRYMLQIERGSQYLLWIEVIHTMAGYMLCEAVRAEPLSNGLEDDLF